MDRSGAILAILTVALVVVITLASYAQLVVVNDKVVEPAMNSASSSRRRRS
ncbi:MAG: hypothetical protein ACLR53_09205 [Evtepia gabavorous]